MHLRWRAWSPRKQAALRHAGREGGGHLNLTEVLPVPAQAKARGCDLLLKIFPLEGTPRSVAWPANTCTPVLDGLIPPGCTLLTNPRRRGLLRGPGSSHLPLQGLPFTGRFFLCSSSAQIILTLWGSSTMWPHRGFSHGPQPTIRHVTCKAFITV